MTTRTATCRCGQLTATCVGKPVRISVCHCLECQKRTGSAFAAQARWPDAQIQIKGIRHTWHHTGDAGSRLTYLFCPECGSTVAYALDTQPGITAIPLGAFADLDFPPPKYSVYEQRKHKWVEITGEEITHSD